MVGLGAMGRDLIGRPVVGRLNPPCNLIGVGKG